MCEDHPGNQPYAVKWTSRSIFLRRKGSCAGSYGTVADICSTRGSRDQEPYYYNIVLHREDKIMREILLNDIAHGRSGDKGDTSNICVFARKPEYYEIIKREVTPERLHDFFGDMVKGEIIRYEVPSLGGFNFVLKHALGGGATMSLRLDSLGKSMGSAIMRLKIHVKDEEL